MEYARLCKTSLRQGALGALPLSASRAVVAPGMLRPTEPPEKVIGADELRIKLLKSNPEDMRDALRRSLLSWS